MRAFLTIALLLILPFMARANPVQIDGQSAIAFGIVAFWALIVESGLVTFALVSRGVMIMPTFVTLIAANLLVFIFAFLPLSGQASLWFLEPGVVVADAVLIRLAMCAVFVQGSNFVGITWRRAFAASLLGNSASFFAGVLASGAPWIVHDHGGGLPPT